MGFGRHRRAAGWLIALMVGATAVAVADPAGAVTLGRVRSTTLLGQTLDVSIPVQLEDGEPFGPECVSVDLMHGDVKVHPDQVLVRIDTATEGGSSRSIRVRTPFALFEPLVTLTVSAGCATRTQRQVVLFVDPPDGVATAPVALAPAPELRTDAATGAVVKRLEGLGAAGPSAVASAAALPASPRWRTNTPDLRVLRRPVRSVDAAPAEPRREAGAVAAAPSPVPAAPAPQPRLKLEAASPSVLAEARPPAAAAPRTETSAATPAAPASAATAAPRASAPATLEDQLAALQSATQAQSETLARLQSQLESQADLQRTRQWLQVLVLVMTGLVAVLGWRLWQVARQTRQALGDGSVAVSAKARSASWMLPDEALQAPAGHRVEGLPDAPAGRREPG